MRRQALVHRVIACFLTALIVVLIGTTGGTTEPSSRFSRAKARVNVGILGQEGHGKAAVTSAITKVLSEVRLANFRPVVEIKQAPEERERGVTIAIAHVGYETEKRHYNHAYLPKHADSMKNMLIGAAQMDGAIWVVSSEGRPTSQTEEQIRLAALTGVKAIVVYLNIVRNGHSEQELEFIEKEILMIFIQLPPAVFLSDDGCQVPRPIDVHRAHRPGVDHAQNVPPAHRPKSIARSQTGA